ncbi:hypothetical protein JCM17960_34990 [Magnetospira thiophila]
MAGSSVTHWTLKRDLALVGLRRKGKSNREIALKLKIAPATVSHRLSFLGVRGWDDGYFELLVEWIGEVERRAKKTLPLLLLLAVASPARAEYPVIDTTAIGKLTDQLSKMQQQIDKLTELSKKAQEQLNALGKMGQITLPLINLAKVGRDLRQDAQCLVPDLSKLMPSVEFEDMDFTSICEAGDAYRQTLWIDPKTITAKPWEDQEKARKAVEVRRDNMIVDAASKGLGQGDVAAQGAEALNKAAGELETAADAAKDQNDRLAVIAKGQVLMARAMAQQTQILAQLLKVQSAYVMKAGVPLDSRLAGDGEEKDE